MATLNPWRMAAIALTLLSLPLAGCAPGATSTPTAATTGAAPSPMPVTTPVPTTAAASTSGLPSTTAPTSVPSPTSSAAPSRSAATPTNAGAASPTAGAAPAADWPTYYRDAARTGVEEAGVTFSQLRPAWRSGALDGDVYAEPLAASGQVVVATQNNTVYSFDLATGRQVWRTHLGEPVPRSMLPCGDISTTGITSTPVIDVASGLVYAVTFVQPGRHQLVALDLKSGTVRFNVPIDPSGANPLTQQQRSALALSRGMVYVAFGGLFGDCGDYHGWVVAADAPSGATRATYQVPTQREGAIWAPPGPAIDASGNLYVATGNGSSSDPAHFDYGDAVLRLSPDLRLLDWFAPSNWVELNDADADIGSVSPALLDNGLIFQIGKSGVGYLLRADHLGQIGGQVFDGQVCSGTFGGTAYKSPVVYVPCTTGLAAVRVVDNQFSVAWRSSGYFAGPPILAGGLVWTLGRDGILRGLDPADGHSRAQLSLGAVTHFATPSASGPYLLIPLVQEIVVDRMN